MLSTVLVLLVSAGGGTPFNEAPRTERKAPGEPVSASAPDDRLTVIADADPVASAVAMSRTLFDRSPVVVVARDGDRAGTLLAASAAVGLGVPLLVDDGGAADA